MGRLTLGWVTTMSARGYYSAGEPGREREAHVTIKTEEALTYVAALTRVLISMSSCGLFVSVTVFNACFD